jgi:anaerobic magnesium-protoporphyrin IX monomethyl ester cyclase
MRYLLVAPKYYAHFNTSLNTYYDFPVGLSYVCATLKSAGQHVVGLNLNHHKNHAEYFQDYVRHNHFDVLCVGGLSGDYRVISEILCLAREVRRDYLVVLGGGLVSSEPEITVRCLEADYGVVGEGEATIRGLAQCLERGLDPATVPGLAIRKPDGSVTLTPTRQSIANLDELPFPDYEAFDFKTYLDVRRPSDFYYAYINDNPRHLPVIGSRSCPYRCTFCYHPLGNTYRKRSIENIFTEVDAMIAKHDINVVMFYDELFASTLSRIEEFCHYAKARNIKFQISMRVNQPTPEILSMLRDAGCFYIGYGLESASPTVLRSMKKKISVEQIEYALRLTREKGIGIQGGFIFGDVAEDEHTVEETISWWLAHKQYQTQLGLIRVYPGSELYNVAVERKIIRDRERFVTKDCPMINVSKLTNPQFAAMAARVNDLAKHYDHFPAHVQAMQYIGDTDRGEGLYEVRFICPNCQGENTIRNICDREQVHRSNRDWMRLGCRHCYQKLDVPFPREQRIKRTVTRLIERVPKGRLALYGAGGHTRMLFSLVPGLAGHLHCIFDRKVPDKDQTFEGVPLRELPRYTPGIKKRVDAVLISSEAFEPSIRKRLDRLLRQGIDVVPLYSE